MFSRKIALFISVTSAIGIIACGDDSSSAGYNGLENYDGSCKFSSTKNSYTLDYGAYKLTTEYTKNSVIFTEDYANISGMDASIKLACNEAKEDADSDTKITCTGSKIIIESYDKDLILDEKGIEKSKKNAQASCENGSYQDADDLEDDIEDISGNDNKKPSSSSSSDKKVSSSSTIKENSSSSSDEEKSSSSKKEEPASSSLEEDTKQECTGDNDGEVFVDDNSNASYCENGKLIEGMPECTEKNEGNKYTYIGTSLICKDNELQPDLGLPDCTEENEGEFKDATIMANGMDVTMTMVCENGEWNEDPECTEEREGKTKNTSLAGIKIVETCTNGEWTF